MKTILILNGTVINENQILEQDIFVKNGKINKIGNDLSSKVLNPPPIEALKYRIKNSLNI